MQGKKPYPFKRNRFYPGKLLTSYDFLVEQRYFDDKRRFINRTVFGPGVVCGMNVYKIDDFSLMIKAGFAFDFDGREILVEKDDIKRLSAIEGFSSTTGDRLSLYVCYSEENITPVFAVDKQEQGEKLEYNHISEGCGFYVSDTSAADEYALKPAFITKRVLMQDKHYLITLEAPSYTCRGLAVCPSVTVTKISSDAGELSFSAKLRAPAFILYGSRTMEPAVEFKIKAGQLKTGEKFSKNVRLVPIGNIDETAISIEKGDATAVSGGNMLELREDVRVPIIIGDLPPQRRIREAVAQISPEDLSGGGTAGLKLAEIKIVRSGDICVIDSVEETAENVEGTPLHQKYYEEYGEFYSAFPAPENRQVQVEEPRDIQPVQQREENVTTGVAEIPLGMKTRVGEVYYSDHITHKLGPGNVFVSVGFESIESGTAKGASQLTVYGDTSLFKDSGISVQTSVRVDATHGTFQIAARLTEQINSIFLTVRWVALRLPDAERYALTTGKTKKRLSVNPATKTLSPKESWAINVEFYGMEPATCRFEVMEAMGGSVTSDGVYTAPSAEGVYDIKISVADEPNLTAYAYAVVKRKEA